VYEDIIAFLALNKAIALSGVEPLDDALDTFRHNTILLLNKHNIKWAEDVRYQAKKNDRRKDLVAVSKPNRNFLHRHIILP
jgi:hypothetical protein